jgi:hypothetical protein
MTRRNRPTSGEVARYAPSDTAEKVRTICLVLLIAIPSGLTGLALSNIEDLPITKWIIGGSVVTLTIITMRIFHLGIFKNYRR